MSALSIQVEETFPPPGMPGSLALGSPEMRDRTTALAGPVAKLLAVQSPEVVDAIRSTARGLLSQYETADGLEIPGMSLVAVATRD